MPSKDKRERDDTRTEEETEEASRKKRSKPSSFLSSDHYHVSWMHAETVTAVCTSLKHGYVLTASSEGVVKFWKRLKVTKESMPAPTPASKTHAQTPQYPCLEFVKSFTSHAGAVQALAMD